MAAICQLSRLVNALAEHYHRFGLAGRPGSIDDISGMKELKRLSTLSIGWVGLGAPDSKCSEASE